MRSKIIVALSLIMLCVVGFLVYKNITSKSIKDYMGEEEPAFKTTVDNYSFYAEDVTDNGAIDIANMLSLLGINDDVVVAEEYMSEDGDDFNRDLIMMHSDDIDYSMPVYSVIDGNDTYYVWSGIEGTIHGLHLDADYNLIEMR